MFEVFECDTLSFNFEIVGTTSAIYKVQSSALSANAYSNTKMTSMC